MEEKSGLIVVLIAVAVVLSLVTMLMIGGIGSVDEEALKNEITTSVLEGMPAQLTAEELAALIVVPAAPEVIIPKFKSNERLDDLWENLHSEDIEELETEAYNVAEFELEDDDYDLLVKWLESEIEGFDELEDVDVEDYEITVVELGLEEEGLGDNEDKVATIVFELEVEYTLESGIVQDYKMQVLATATVVFDEGDFSDEDVELVFA